MILELIDEPEEKGKAFIHSSADGDFFPTPYSMTRQFLEREYFDYSGSVLEPACGGGHMSKILKEKFRAVNSYDLKDGHDFYKEKERYDYVITNPPYGKEADKFVIKAKSVTKHKFAMLLRTNYLSGQERYDSEVYRWLRDIYVFTRMPDLRPFIKTTDKEGKVSLVQNPIREDGTYPTAGIVYAWMVWDVGYIGKPSINWIDNQKYVLKKKDR